jgi:recombination DNA repair RAD52 pathway protein
MPELTQAQLAKLLQDLHPGRVAQRAGVGGSNKLSYLEAWDVKASLIRVFGFGGFSAEAFDMRILKVEQDLPKKSGNGVTPYRVTASCGVKLTIHALNNATYTEYAASSQSGSDPGEVMDFAIKTAESDALKRAAIYLGTQFGLSLYNKGGTRDVVRQVLAPEQQINTEKDVEVDIESGEVIEEVPVDPAKAAAARAGVAAAFDRSRLTERRSPVADGELRAATAVPVPIERLPVNQPLPEYLP